MGEGLTSSSACFAIKIANKSLRSPLPCALNVARISVMDGGAGGCREKEGVGRLIQFRARNLGMVQLKKKRMAHQFLCENVTVESEGRSALHLVVVVVVVVLVLAVLLLLLLVTSTLVR
jgi:hypothetical protein